MRITEVEFEPERRSMGTGRDSSAWAARCEGAVLVLPGLVAEHGGLRGIVEPVLDVAAEIDILIVGTGTEIAPSARRPFERPSKPPASG
jgi:hypothetical protein